MTQNSNTTDTSNSLIDNDVTNHITLHAQLTTTFVRKYSQLGKLKAKNFKTIKQTANKAYRSNEGTSYQGTNGVTRTLTDTKQTAKYPR